jgi:hypothetical protein
MADFGQNFGNCGRRNSLWLMLVPYLVTRVLFAAMKWSLTFRLWPENETRLVGYGANHCCLSVLARAAFVAFSGQARQ